MNTLVYIKDRAIASSSKSVFGRIQRIENCLLIIISLSAQLRGLHVTFTLLPQVALYAYSPPHVSDVFGHLSAKKIPQNQSSQLPSKLVIRSHQNQLAFLYSVLLFVETQIARTLELYHFSSSESSTIILGHHLSSVTENNVHCAVDTKRDTEDRLNVPPVNSPALITNPQSYSLLPFAGITGQN